MAQLPPKIPNMTPNWSEFSHQKLPSMTPIAAATMNTQNPSWVDEFLDFSSVRRGSHRRSVSDSIAFMEAPSLEECSTSCGTAAGALANTMNHHHHDFDKFDDEQFMSMFTDDIACNAMAPTVSSSNPSTPSDHNSFNDEKETQPCDQKQQQIRKESDEVESLSKTDCHKTPSSVTHSALSSDRMIDPKRVKRILANRQSAQRSRVRKLQYISELERSVTSLQAEVSVLSPRVAFLDHQRLLLNVDNSALKQRIAALAHDKIFKDAHQEALKREIERLTQVYHQQSLKKIDNAASTDHANATNEKEQLLNV
ncbi:bZIP_2 domain-containing protein [Cephalotus follicularis]|uniref:BZIP_2 domain-containing protein n=1 Tax=Cephalotus follicularis TaxID=3775 RepID=A0A1Q3C7A3_CEPFO|nr:bZIP_2 domain-containing protein [Cephalotus follicularis]